MVEKFADSYRIRSSRLQNRDYGWRGQYYVIIFTREGMLFWRDNRWANGRRDAMHGVSTSDTDGGLLQKGNKKSGPQRKNLSSITRGFKSAVTTDARMINADFGWQSRFYERMIRDEEYLNNIRRYIKENPGKWTIDELNPENSFFISLPLEKQAFLLQGDYCMIPQKVF